MHPWGVLQATFEL
ncbi:hypothetical protein YPPY02_1137, partial [Yersinia pestis PY-02]